MQHHSETTPPRALLAGGTSRTSSPIFHRLGRLVCSFAALLAMHFLSMNTSAQVTVGSVTPNSGHDVLCTRWSDGTEEQVYEGMEVRANDLVVCRSGNAILQLNSGPDTIFTASGPFRFALLEPKGMAMRVWVFTGNGDMQSNYPTCLISGETRMGPQCTEYSIRLRRTSEGPTREYLVYEGEVNVSSPGLDKRISTGQKLSVNPRGAPVARQIDFEDIDRIVNVYSQVDVSKAERSGTVGFDRDRLYERYRSLYTSVFQDPKNPLKRADLAVEQVNSGSSSSAIYQLSKAEEFTPGSDPKLLVRVAVLKGLALKNTGNPEEANKEFRKATRIDPDALTERKLRDYKLNTVAIEGLRVLGSLVGPPRNEQDRLMKLIDNKQFEEAIAGFSKRLNAKDVDSRDYYGLALAYSYGIDVKSAIGHAKTALDWNRKDGQLSPDEVKTAELIPERLSEREKRQGPPEYVTKRPPEYVKPRPPSETSAGPWPIPPGSTKDQHFLFGLIAAGRYDEALAGFQKIRPDSITQYGMAVIHYELKKFVDASSLAKRAMELNKEDGLLSRDAYEACNRIYRAPLR
jgi:tetratricopeptide (TPR) repeat protein